MSAIERLDLAARLQARAQLFQRAPFYCAFLTVSVIGLALGNGSPLHERFLMRILAAVCVVATTILWLNWRHKVYAQAALCMCFAAVNVLSHDHARSHTALGWIDDNLGSLLFVYYACGLWILAGRYAMVNSNRWQKEREQLAEWLTILRSPGRADVVEFAAGNFWTGYWTYRVFNPGNCWIIAQFKRGTSRLSGCRVRQPDEVAFARLPSGKWKVDIMGKGKKSFAEVDISSQLPPVFQPFIRQASL